MSGSARSSLAIRRECVTRVDGKNRIFHGGGVDCGRGTIFSKSKLTGNPSTCILPAATPCDERTLAVEASATTKASDGQRYHTELTIVESVTTVTNGT